MNPMDPMETIFNGHLMDPMDMSNGVHCSIETMDPLDKNTKLMFTRQARFGDCVHWIHSDGSIGRIQREGGCTPPLREICTPPEKV